MGAGNIMIKSIYMGKTNIFKAGFEQSPCSWLSGAGHTVVDFTARLHGAGVTEICSSPLTKLLATSLKKSYNIKLG